MVYKLQYGLCIEPYYRVCVRYLAVRSGKHTGISTLTNKRVQPRKNSGVYHHLLNCNYSPTFEDFSVLCRENKKYLLESKESLLIMIDIPLMNQKYVLPLSICLNKFFSNCLLYSLDFGDQFFILLCNFFDLRKNCNF